MGGEKTVNVTPPEEDKRYSLEILKEKHAKLQGMLQRHNGS